jgi:hypothetical protein
LSIFFFIFLKGLYLKKSEERRKRVELLKENFQSPDNKLVIGENFVKIGAWGYSAALLITAIPIVGVLL